MDDANKELEVNFIYRTKGIAYSIERVFDDVRKELGQAVSQSDFYTPFRNPGSNPKSFFGNLRAAQKAAVQGVNHITGDCNYLALGLPKKGLVVTVHDCGHINVLTGLKRQIFRWLWFQLPIHRAEAVTFISEYSRQDLETALGIKIPNARVIPDPVSESFFEVEKPFPTSMPRILFIGTKANKNLERFVEAINGLDVELRIVGRLSDDQKNALEKNKIRYSQVADLSHAQIVAEYQEADIVSLVSTFEGFGLPIVEGQATGRPVITSNVCSMPDVAGDAALLVDPFSVSDMREGIVRLCSDEELRADLVEKGRINVKRFSAKRVAEQYLDLYRELHP
ncbi:MAG: glycosyltransferase family 1 protein [Verrucomicrobiota bacterium]